MKRSTLLIAALAAIATVAPLTATQAQQVSVRIDGPHWGVRIGAPGVVVVPAYPPPVIYAPPPVIYAPPPVIYAPAPVVAAPPRVVYAPAPVIYGPPRVVYGPPVWMPPGQARRIVRVYVEKRYRVKHRHDDRDPYGHGFPPGYRY